MFKKKTNWESGLYIFIFKTFAGLLVYLGIQFRNDLIQLGVILSLGSIPFHYWILYGFRSLTPRLLIYLSFTLKFIPLILLKCNLTIITLTRLTRLVGALWILTSQTFSGLLVSSGISQLGFIVTSNEFLGFRAYLSIYYLLTYLLVLRNLKFLIWWAVAALPPRPLFLFKGYTLISISRICSLILILSVVISLITYIKWIIRFQRIRTFNSKKV